MIPCSLGKQKDKVDLLEVWVVYNRFLKYCVSSGIGNENIFSFFFSHGQEGESRNKKEKVLVLAIPVYICEL